MLVVPDVGTSWLLERLKADFNAGPLKIHLYQNDYSPTLTSLLADFTEANFPGYGVKNVSFSQPVAFDPQGHGFLLADAVTWLSTAAPEPNQRVFGYFITNAANAVVIWSERFERRIWIRKAGLTIIVYPRFGALTEFTG